MMLMAVAAMTMEGMDMIGLAMRAVGHVSIAIDAELDEPSGRNEQGLELRRAPPERAQGDQKAAAFDEQQPQANHDNEAIADDLNETDRPPDRPRRRPE